MQFDWPGLTVVWRDGVGQVNRSSLSLARLPAARKRRSAWGTQSPGCGANQTQTQTKFIQQKQIQVPYQVYITFMNIHIIISPWHINDLSTLGDLRQGHIWPLAWKPPEKEKHARQWWKLQCNLMLIKWKTIYGLEQGIMTYMYEYNGDTAKW